MKYNEITPYQDEMGSTGTANPSLKYFQIPNSHTEAFWIVEEVLDGDSLTVKQEFGKQRREIRLYRLDAPEVSFSRKMSEDEAKSGIAATLLLQYGMMSLEYVLQVCPPGTRITLVTDLKNRTDFWLRDLAYVILPGGECLNELILRNGYAKPSSDYFCFHLPYFQQINTFAKMQKKGIYAFTSDL